MHMMKQLATPKEVEEGDENITNLISRLSQKDKIEEEIPFPEDEGMVKFISQLSQTEMIEEELSPEGEKRELVEDELRVLENTSISTSWAYLTALYNGSILPPIFLAQLAFHGLRLPATLGWFGSLSQPLGSLRGGQQHTDFALLSPGHGKRLLCYSHSTADNNCGIFTGRELFKNMLRAIFRAPLSSESTATGRILAGDAITSLSFQLKDFVILSSIALPFEDDMIAAV